MMRYYILMGKVAVRAKNIEEYGVWFQRFENRRVALDEFEGVRVSTVFLGIDHNHGKGDPILFETMVFTDIEGEEDMRRYSTWDEAVLGHKEIVEHIKENMQMAKIHSDSTLKGIFNQKNHLPESNSDKP